MSFSQSEHIIFSILKNSFFFNTPYKKSLSRIHSRIPVYKYSHILETADDVHDHLNEINNGGSQKIVPETPFSHITYNIILENIINKTFHRSTITIRKEIDFTKI